MFLKKWTMKSTENCLNEIEKLKEKIEKTDVIVIGAGAGLSTSAGLTHIMVKDLKNVFLILKENMELKICIQVGFIHLTL